MIPFTIDTNNFLDWETDEPRFFKAQIKEVMALWRRYGGVGYFSSAELDRLKEIILLLPDNLQKQYMNSLESLPLHDFPEEVVHSVSSDKSSYSTKNIAEPVKLLVSPRNYWDHILQLPEEGEMLVDADRPLSVVRADGLLHSDLVLDFEDRSSSPITKNQSVDDVWNTRFKDILECATAKRITLVDSFALSGVTNFETLCRSGVVGFISKLAGIKRKKHVTLYCSDKITSKNNEELSFEERRDYLASLMEDIPRKHHGTFTLRFVKNKDFSKLKHDRYIRVNGVCWEIGSGMEIFQSQRHHDNISLAIKCSESVYSNCRSVEDELTTKSERMHATYNIY